MADTKFKKGQKPWNTGKKFSKETLLKMSLSKINAGIKPPSRKGIKMSEEQKQKLRGRKMTVEQRAKLIGRKVWNKGIKGVIKASLETRRKISDSHKKRFIGKKINTPIYFKIRNCFEYRLWRSDIFKRDNFTCQVCGDNKGGNLNADHIKPFALILFEEKIDSLEKAICCEKLWDINNGITLCKTCHQKTDTWGTKTTNLIKQYAK